MAEELLINVSVNVADGDDKIGKLRAEIDSLTDSTRKLSKEVQKAKEGDTEKVKLLGAEMSLLKEKRSLQIFPILSEAVSAGTIFFVESFTFLSQ